MSSSLPVLPSVPSDQFYDTVEITNPTTVQVEEASKLSPVQMYGAGGNENVKSRMESQELSIRHSSSE